MRTKVFDNNFTPDFLVKLYIASVQIPWEYTNTSNRVTYPHKSKLSVGNLPFFFGNRLFNKENSLRVTNCEVDDVFWEVLEHFCFNLYTEENLELIAIDANLQLQGMDGDWHSDVFTEPDDGSNRTIMFYPMYEWFDDWGGELEIQNEDGNISRLLPKPGRFIYFDSKKLHRGLAPTVPNKPRMSIAFRMRVID